ncbi:hypothetical protein ALC53_08691 [Atta colombica]|uniref:Uncharacterized protein n=1 Tax=Atta colombica TaxID=520822 RepID=A0A151I247_9HYME|nr:hypothetical protein ALC53_08691 [Atta colombica]
MYSQKAGGGSRTKRDGEQVGGREDAKCEGVKTGNPVTMRSAGGWGLLDLFEDQEEDVEEARETQTVVGRESDGSRPARASRVTPDFLIVIRGSRTNTLISTCHSQFLAPIFLAEFASKNSWIERVSAKDEFQKI